jgi:Sugar phosphate isomerases/epimerases
MKICFSTLACPGWTLERVLEIAISSGYDAIELRFLEGEDSLWKLPVFQGAALKESDRRISESGLSVACVGTSCRFHSPDPSERAKWVDEGIRMSELATALHARGIRVFGDKIQPGADRASTRTWIAEGIRKLAERTRELSARPWLETHGDFASSSETMAILNESGRQGVGVVWDAANAFTDGQEQPLHGVHSFGNRLQHVHLRDVECRNDQWQPVLAGEGKLGLSDIVAELKRLKYDHFVSFEWEKKWRPELAEPEIAIPHFARWFKQNSHN